MIESSAASFRDFYSALWGGQVPFDWQEKLAERVCTNSQTPWPEVIALPTAAGKTACIDIAVFALAAEAPRLAPGQPLKSPRRIFFVVDRRVIVDEAYRRAARIAERLRQAEHPILRDVANRLRRLAGGGEPLACYELRGGMYRSDAWAHSPVQPAIIASTVDQLGSRLLFRAYGRFHLAWPIQAGLAGNDALVLLDEAHCAQPFMETLQAVARYRQGADVETQSPFYLTVMSATPPEGPTDIFRDVSAEGRTKGHPLGDRQLASKLAAIVTPTVGDRELAVKVREAEKRLKEAKGGPRRRAAKDLASLRREAVSNLARALAHEAEGLVGDGNLAVVVFCNRVAGARETCRLLRMKHGERVTLLTGRMRPIDKDDIAATRLAVLAADRSMDRRLDGPIFVVATQTLEVGANLDFDVMATECASLDALRQRFGRLNRMGREIGAKAAILVRADQAMKSDDDPVYGAALAETWKWLVGQAGKPKKIDMGIAALEARLTKGEDLQALNAPTLHAPVMLPSHVDCWAQTAPEPIPSPDVGIFLHGPERPSADVQVCWRADLLLEATDDDWLEVLSLCPPSTPECLPVPIGTLRGWLGGDDDAGSEDVDVEGSAQLENVPSHRRERRRRVVQWRGRRDARVVCDPQGLRPGDVVVLPAQHQGWGVLGDLPPGPNGKHVLDWGDRAHLLARRKAVLRLHPSLIATFPECSGVARIRELAVNTSTRLDEDPDSFVRDLKAALKHMATDPAMAGWGWLVTIAGDLAHDAKLQRGLSVHPSGGIILRGSRRLPVAGECLAPSPGDMSDDFSDEDDETASCGARSVGLARHMDGVGVLARRFGEGCGLPASLVDTLELAGRAHDLGKADPRFQAWLRGGDPWARGELLAKSEELPQSRWASRRARARAGYPEGGRHELLSVRLLESAHDCLPNDVAFRELALHLVESHHGHCRPFAPVVFDEKPVSATVEFFGQRLLHSSVTGMERLDSGAAERFWRLTRQHGWWGLAWLEAILRLADHRRSEAEQGEQPQRGRL
jgi:CRISPR-associated endonuclease/helicase Cas3